MDLWPEVRSGSYLEDLLCDAMAVRVWRETFELVYKGLLDTWDVQWTFACWVQSGLTVLPGKNLVTNIGVGSGATHTVKPSPFANLPVESMTFPLAHPRTVVRNRRADDYTQEAMFNPHGVWRILFSLSPLYGSFRKALRQFSRH